MIIDDIIESTKERVVENKKLHSIEKIAKLAFDKPINFDYPLKKPYVNQDYLILWK